MNETQEVRSTGSIADSMREYLANSEEADEVLRDTFLNSVLVSLFKARKGAGLSQAQVAEKMGTSQPNIARMERDDAGRFSLHRLLDYFLACDVVPLQLEFAPAEHLRQMMSEDPLTPMTLHAYRVWRSVQDNGSDIRVQLRDTSGQPQFVTRAGRSVAQWPISTAGTVAESGRGESTLGTAQSRVGSQGTVSAATGNQVLPFTSGQTVSV